MTTDQSNLTTEPTRRDFLKLAWLGLGAVALAEAGGMAVAFSIPRLGAGDFGGIISAGAVDDFPPNSVTPFNQGRFYLSRLADGGFLALYRKCTHLGCAVPWDQPKGEFLCPCHASAFDARGEVLNPPAPRALDLFPVIIEDGVVKVDTGTIIQRDRFDAAQVVYD
ncbi:MAG: ubiquinol-cytochrome c reductase iron-sulfur subunit [Anaerolineales bacterium]|nr:ubiquinol-cytochrome c reductase iron-sulfur subunit [Anaerolineales bacterium]